MVDPLEKHKRRQRRKRNLIARELRSGRFKHQVKPGVVYKRQEAIKDVEDGLRGDEA